MPDHTRALVPLESWCYSSPELRVSGRSVDVGLLAEALIYYDKLLVNVTNQPQFAELLRWFIGQDQLQGFFSLVKDGVITLYEYSFMSTAVKMDNSELYSIWNMQDEAQAQPNSFEQRFLYHQDVQQLFSHARERSRLYEALRGHVIEVKADQFGPAIENARADFIDPRRNGLVVQAFVDSLYALRNLGRPPEVSATVVPKEDGSGNNITWNVDFGAISKLAGKELNFHNSTPITAGAVCNRLLWSAAQQNCDLFLGNPMSTLAGDKLYEATRRPDKSKVVIDQLVEKVEFPDVRMMVNNGKLQLKDILDIRNRANRFRGWLQNEAERDRDAIIAYHHEVTRESGFKNIAQRTLSIFGVLGGGAVGGAVGAAMAGPVGGAIGGAAGAAVTYVTDLAARISADWKPVVFGNWMRDRIKKVLDEKKN